MKIIPKIVLRGGKVFYQGTESASENVFIEELCNSLKEKGITHIHILDLDGHLSGRPVNYKEAAKIKKIGLSVQFEGGVRDKNTVKLVLDEGIDRVVLSVRVAIAPYFIQELTKIYKDRIMVYIEAYNNIVTIRGWNEIIEYNAADLGRQLKKDGVEEVIFKEIKRGSLFGGLNLEVIKKFIDTTNINVQIVDVSSEDEIKDLLAYKDKDRISGILIDQETLLNNKLNLDSIIALVRSEKEVKSEKGEVALTMPLSREYLTDIEQPLCEILHLPIPVATEGFTHHKDVIREIQAQLSTKPNKKILIEGESGIGKTYLLANIFSLCKLKYKSFWYSFEQDNLAEVFVSYLIHAAELISINGYEMAERYERLSSKLPEDLVLFLDDLHLIKDYNLKNLITALTENTNLKIIMTTAQTLDYSLSIDKRITLDKLTKEEAIEYLRYLNLEEKDQVLEDIFNNIGGEPRLLFYFAALVNRFWYEPVGLLRKLPYSKDEWQNFFLDRIFNDVSEDIQIFLEMMSLLQRPVDVFILKPLYEGIGFDEMFDGLRKMIDILKTADGRYFLSLEVVKFLSLKVKDRRFQHKRIANIYTNFIKDTETKKVEYYLELYYHNFSAGMFTDAVSVLMNIADELISLGWIHTLLRELSKFDTTMINLDDWLWLCLYKARVYSYKLQYDKAEEIYTEVLDMASKLEAQDALSHALYYQAKLFRKTKNIHRAINNYKLILHNKDKLSKNKKNFYILKNTYKDLIELSKEDKSMVDLYMGDLEGLEVEWKEGIGG